MVGEKYPRAGVVDFVRGLRYTGTGSLAQHKQSTHGFIAIFYEPQLSRDSCLPTPSHGIGVGVIIQYQHAHAKFR